jgi:hypothetical protein
MAPKKKVPLLPPPPLVLDVERTTPAMRRSLDSLRSSLLCPLCNQVLQKPSTLPCAHTFCYDCIDDYICNAWTCPSVGCGMPVTATGTRGGKYLKINPQYQTVVTSFDVICTALNEAPKEWWREDTPDEVDDLHTGEGERYSVKRGQDNDVNEHSSQDENNINNININNNKENEVVDFNTSPPKQARMESSPPLTSDSQKTAIFPDQSSNLALQSPGCSPIPHIASQLSTVDESQTSTRKSVSFETTPHFVLVSKLSAKDQKKVTALVEKQQFELLQLNDMLQSSYTPKSTLTAVCGNPDMQTGDGYLVGRTFGYLWAIAAKLSVVHVSYLDQLTDDPKHHQVIGDTSCTTWMAPQRSRATRTKLLHDYTILLCGDFDILPHTPGKEVVADKLYTRHRVQTLLTLCGARVLNVEALGMKEHEQEQLAGDKYVILIKPNPQRRDWKSAVNIVQACAQLKDASLSIVCSNWLLDSIADYEPLPFDNYKQSAFKKRR